MQKLISHSLEETDQIAREWLLEMETKYAQRDRALVVGLSGHLGAGKTAFVKAVAKALEIEESVTSPTFVIMKMYDCRSIQWKKLIHIDLYRLEKKEEMVALKLEEVIGDKNNLIMIEWPENVGLKVDEQIDFRALEEAGVYEIVY
jgi:tRNA threonylcarbamoyl adenosine modification protein YjeE